MKYALISKKKYTKFKCFLHRDQIFFIIQKIIKKKCNLCGVGWGVGVCVCGGGGGEVLCI